METLILALVVSVFVAGMFLVGISVRKQRLEAWRRFAERHSLKLVQQSGMSRPRITGRWKGVPVVLQIEMRGSGNSRKAYTRATARFSATLPRGLDIAGENFTHKVAKLLGGQDIQVGELVTDRALRIKGDEPAEVRRLLGNWRVRSAVLSFLVNDPRALVTQTQLGTARLGHLTKDGELAALLERVSGTVKEIESGLAGGLWETPPPPAQELELDEPEEEARGSLLSGFSIEPIGLIDEEDPPAPPEPPPQLAGLLADFGLREAGAATPSPAPPPPPPAPPPEPPPELELPTPEEPSSPSVAPAQPPLPIDALRRLEQRGLSPNDRTALAATLMGGTVTFELAVERVSMSTGVDLPAHLQDGHTVIGRLADGPRIAVRFPPSRSQAVSQLGYGDKLTVLGRVGAWDDFYRQLIVEAP